MLQGSFKGISRTIEGCFNGVLSGFQGCLKVVQWVFEERYSIDVSRKFLGVVKREHQELFKDVQRLFQGSLKPF